jgi:hypothetical protein
MPLWFEIAVLVLLLAIGIALGGIEVSILKLTSSLDKAIQRNFHTNLGDD